MISTKLQGLVSAVELGLQDAVPAVAAGARRSRQREQIGSVRHAGACPGLHRGCADLLPGQHVERDGKAVDFLFVDRAMRLDGDVAAGQSGAASGNYRVNIRIRYPESELAGDSVRVVRTDCPVRELVS